MEAIKLRDGFCWTGIIDDKLRVFDIVMYTEFGTTYNSYVMKTSLHCTYRKFYPLYAGNADKAGD